MRLTGPLDDAASLLGVRIVANEKLDAPFAFSREFDLTRSEGLTPMSPYLNCELRSRWQILRREDELLPALEPANMVLFPE